MEKHFSFLPDNKWSKEKKAFYENHIKKHIGKKFIKDIMPFHIKDVMKAIEDTGASIRTVGRVLEVLKPAFKEALQNRIIDHNPIESLTVKRPVTKKIVTNATDELVQIHNAICDEFRSDPFYKALFFLALQGRRKNEILSLKWEDVNFEKSFYILRQTKNNEEQKIFLPDDIKKLLSDIYDESQEYVFTSPVTGTKLQCTKRVVARVRKRLDNDKFGLHYLRNVIVSAMAEQGLESIYLSGALGHNDPNTIKKYLTMNYLKSSEMASGVIAGIVGKQ
jgi:integrase